MRKFFSLSLVWIGVLLLAACGDTLEYEFEEVPATGDIERGSILFQQSLSGEATCISCHTLSGEDKGSPALEGFGERAGTVVDGMSAREYAFYAIADPGRHIAEGFGNAMPTKYDNVITPQQMAHLIAFILSL